VVFFFFPTSALIFFLPFLRCSPAFSHRESTTKKKKPSTGVYDADTPEHGAPHGSLMDACLYPHRICVDLAIAAKTRRSFVFSLMACCFRSSLHAQPASVQAMSSAQQASEGGR
jgi:hypothetical protein